MRDGAPPPVDADQMRWPRSASSPARTTSRECDLTAGAGAPNITRAIALRPCFVGAVLLRHLGSTVDSSARSCERSGERSSLSTALLRTVSLEVARTISASRLYAAACV